MNDEVVDKIFNCLCSRCGENSGGMGFLVANENGKETPVMICWKCLKEIADEMIKMEGDVNDA